jgi:ABC-type Mn2+/Zn2+ transport system permease subunit
MFDTMDPFFLPVVASALAAGALAMSGAHLAARQRTLHSLCLAQGAEMGALLGALITLAHSHALDETHNWWGLSGSLAGSIVAGLVAIQMSQTRPSSRTVSLFSAWIAFIAITHLSVAAHPQLESHLSRVFLGDFATLPNAHALVLAVFSLVVLCLFFAYQKTFVRNTFDNAVLGLILQRKTRAFELLPFYLLPAFSTWAAGFLFTCAFLFVPTTLMASENKSSTQSIKIGALVAMISAPLGMQTSLHITNLPTVPTMIFTLVCTCFLARATTKLYVFIGKFRFG